jgi:hypothetical protein
VDVVSDLFWDATKLRAAMITSFGCDYKYLASILHGMPTNIHTEVVVCDNYDRSKFNPQVRFGTPSTGPNQPPPQTGTNQPPPQTGANQPPPQTGANQPAANSWADRFTVVWPRTTTTEPTGVPASVLGDRRIERGTVHPKLTLLQFEGFLRVVVSSANVGRYEREVTQQFWVYDAPRIASAVAKCGGGKCCVRGKCCGCDCGGGAGCTGGSCCGGAGCNGGGCGSAFPSHSTSTVGSSTSTVGSSTSTVGSSTSAVGSSTSTVGSSTTGNDNSSRNTTSGCGGGGSSSVSARVKQPAAARPAAPPPTTTTAFQADLMSFVCEILTLPGNQTAALVSTWDHVIAAHDFTGK